MTGRTGEAGRAGARRPWVAIASLSGAVSVVVGAFAAHGMDPANARAIDLLHKGSLYEVVHALAMLAAVALAAAGAIGTAWAERALWAFLMGTALFCGALYGLAFGGPNWLGAVAPLGGFGFIAGWSCLAAGGFGGTVSVRPRSGLERDRELETVGSVIVRQRHEES